ncbi:MAG TPA: methyltransferase domain-containing protein [Pyrinomonadaceae bacterium]|nr:methyltransferase domain-containing protein [Pyrinomonadaceae bacterium]
MTTRAHGKLPEVEEVRRYLKSFDFFERHVGNRWEGDFYADVHARRFVETLKFLPDLPSGARVLELGAVPYYMTCLLVRHFDLSVEPLSFYEVETDERARHVVESALYGERYEFEYRACNVERDLFPFDDESFDLVLCCEILEHLLINPSHMLYESHRVLRPGGRLLVTTPNVLQWRNVFALLRGRNIYDLYRGNGIYGRHNREYAPGEVAELLEANGFEVERVETVHVYGSDLLNRVPVVFDQRRDNIFALARRGLRARMAFPASLYVLMDEYRNAVRAHVRMGVNETGQLGRGWHEFEGGGPGFRWSKGEAELFLRNDAARRRLSLTLCCHHPEVEREGVRVRLRVNGREAGEAEIRRRDWHELSFTLPEGVASDAVLRCELQVSPTWIPQQHGLSEDPRELGIGLSDARLE